MKHFGQIFSLGHGFKPVFLAKGRCSPVMVGLWLLFVLSPSVIASSMIFGREELFTFSSGNISGLNTSGFTTVILFVVDVETNGDLNYNGDHLIITNGTCIGDSAWPSRLAALKSPSPHLHLPGLKFARVAQAPKAGTTSRA